MIHTTFIRSLRWLRRFRKRRGYGIHSPAAFQFVTGVVYEKGEYYAYGKLREERRKLRLSSREKDDRLLFRLVNFHHPKSVVAVGSGREFDVACCYIKSARQCPVYQFDNVVEKGGEMPASDFYYLDDAAWSEGLSALLDRLADGVFVVVRLPHRNPQSHQAWQALCADPRVRQSYDLHDFGICLCEARLNKEHFVINYY